MWDKTKEVFAGAAYDTRVGSGLWEDGMSHEDMEAFYGLNKDLVNDVAKSLPIEALNKFILYDDDVTGMGRVDKKMRERTKAQILGSILASSKNEKRRWGLDERTNKVGEGEGEGEYNKRYLGGLKGTGRGFTNNTDLNEWQAWKDSEANMKQLIMAAERSNKSTFENDDGVVFRKITQEDIDQFGSRWGTRKAGDWEVAPYKMVDGVEVAQEGARRSAMPSGRIREMLMQHPELIMEAMERNAILKKSYIEELKKLGADVSGFVNEDQFDWKYKSALRGELDADPEGAKQAFTAGEWLNPTTAFGIGKLGKGALKLGGGAVAKAAAGSAAGSKAAKIRASFNKNADALDQMVNPLAKGQLAPNVGAGVGIGVATETAGSHDDATMFGGAVGGAFGGSLAKSALNAYPAAKQSVGRMWYGTDGKAKKIFGSTRETEETGEIMDNYSKAIFVGEGSKADKTKAIGGSLMASDKMMGAMRNAPPRHKANIEAKFGEAKEGMENIIKKTREKFADEKHADVPFYEEGFAGKLRDAFSKQEAPTNYRKFVEDNEDAGTVVSKEDLFSMIHALKSNKHDLGAYVASINKYSDPDEIAFAQEYRKVVNAFRKNKNLTDHEVSFNFLRNLESFIGRASHNLGEGAGSVGNAKKGAAGMIKDALGETHDDWLKVKKDIAEHKEITKGFNKIMRADISKNPELIDEITADLLKKSPQKFYEGLNMIASVDRKLRNQIVNRAVGHQARKAISEGKVDEAFDLVLSPEFKKAASNAAEADKHKVDIHNKKTAGYALEDEEHRVRIVMNELANATKEKPTTFFEHIAKIKKGGNAEKALNKYMSVKGKGEGWVDGIRTINDMYKRSREDVNTLKGSDVGQGGSFERFWNWTKDEMGIRMPSVTNNMMHAVMRRVAMFYISARHISDVIQQRANTALSRQMPQLFESIQKKYDEQLHDMIAEGEDPNEVVKALLHPSDPKYASDAAITKMFKEHPILMKFGKAADSVMKDFLNNNFDKGNLAHDAVIASGGQISQKKLYDVGQQYTENFKQDSEERKKKTRERIKNQRAKMANTPERRTL